MAAVSAVLFLVLGAAALGEDALVPDEVGHGLEQLQTPVARIGGGGLSDVERPRDLTHQQVIKRDGRCIGGPLPRPPRRRPRGQRPRPG